MRRLFIHDHNHLGSRDVPDFTVQRQVHRRLGTDVVDKLILPRMPSERESATHHPLVEPVQPTQPATVVEVDVARMHHLLDWRIPAKPHVAHRHIEDAHPSGRDHSKLEFAIVDLDQANPLLLAPVKSALVDRPTRLALVTGKLAAGQLPTLRVDVSLRACQNLVVRRRLNRRGDRH